MGVGVKHPPIFSMLAVMATRFVSEVLGCMDYWSWASTHYFDVQDDARCNDVMQFVGHTPTNRCHGL